MSITEILEEDPKVMPNEEKVVKIADIVSSARKSYGNSDTVIESPEVNTTDGMMEIKYLKADTKIELVKKEINTIKLKAIEASKNQQGVVMDKVIEELISINPILVNISDTTKFTYL